nr:hypothetical protein [Tanacetum cinerariifolium]
MAFVVNSVHANGVDLVLEKEFASFVLQAGTIPLRDIISQLPPSIVITTFPPILSTFKHPKDYLIMRNEDLNTILEKESKEFIKSSVEDLVPILSEFEDTSGNDNYEAFYFDDDHIEEKSSGNTTTHSDFSLPEYDSFIFDLSIDPFPPSDRSVSHHEEFVDELTYIISSPEYDCFYFDTETNSGELTILFEENISKDSTKEFTSPELNDFYFLLSDCDSTFSEEFSEIDLLVSFPFENKDKVFDPDILEKTFSP